MRTLYLHIGHGKTGSSYIQSALAGSVEALGNLGIEYPPHQGIEAAAHGSVSSGNGRNLLTEGFRLYGERTLLSGEQLFGLMATGENRGKIDKALAGLGAEQIKVLLFIRDPVSNCCSSYQQSVKRNGNTREISKAMRSFSRPEQVNKVLNYLDGQGAETTVFNYSRERDRLIECLEKWLDVPVGSISRPPVGVINRSMTRSEIVFQKHLNRAFKGAKCGHIFSERLCDELPYIIPDDMRPSIEEQEALWDRLADTISWVNARIPTKARYTRERDVKPPKFSADDPLYFTEDQVRILAEVLAEKEQQLRKLKCRFTSPRARSAFWRKLWLKKNNSAKT